MSDSTSLLTQLTAAQAGKEITVNELMNSVSPASLFGRRQSSSGLNWDYFGGRMMISGTSTAIANGTIALTASLTNYIECDPATGTVSKNTTAFTTGRVKLYSVLAGASTVTSYVDHRAYTFSSSGNFANLTIGDNGSESSGIDINGVVYESTFKVSDINGTNYAQTILHRHSTTLEPLIVAARSNSNTSSHTAVTTGQNLFSLYASGWTSGHYDLFGSQSFSVGTGTVSATSSPGKWVLNLTPDGSNTPAAVITADSDKSLVLGGSLKVLTGFGCNGSTPQTAVTVNAAATDLATAIALVNQLRAALIANGVCV